jgi:hypothetical protein
MRRVSGTEFLKASNLADNGLPLHKLMPALQGNLNLPEAVESAMNVGLDQHDVMNQGSSGQ